MAAIIAQENGLTLHISNDDGLLHVKLSGTLLQAAMTADATSAAENGIPLASFLTETAYRLTEQTAEWRSFCQELSVTVSTEPEFTGFVLLRINMGSTSDDECDWQLSATLKLPTEQLIGFAACLASSTLPPSH